MKGVEWTWKLDPVCCWRSPRYCQIMLCNRKLPNHVLVMHYFKTPHEKRVNSNRDWTKDWRTMSTSMELSFLSQASCSIEIALEADMQMRKPIISHMQGIRTPWIKIGTRIANKLAYRKVRSALTPQQRTEVDVPMPKRAPEPGFSENEIGGREHEIENGIREGQYTGKECRKWLAHNVTGEII